MNARGSLAGLLTLTALAGCAGTPIVRIARPELLSAGPPVIDRLVDLGGMALPRVGPIGQQDSDGVLTPGEWVAMLGQRLDAGDLSRVTVDGVSVEVQGHLQGGSLLLRVPRHLGPRRPHRLVVTTPSGSASATFTLKSYVVVGDTQAQAVRFIPIDPAGKTVLSPSVTELQVQEAYKHALSPSGAFLYIVQELGQPAGQSSAGLAIAVVHMGAPKRPRMLGSFPVQNAATPTSVTMLDENTLLVLSESDLLVCDVGGGRVAPVARVDLPRSTTEKSLYLDLVALANRSVVVLEAYGNTVTLVDLANPAQPRVTTPLEVGAVKGLPWSIDLANDPADGNAAWLVQGPNLRISGDRAKRLWDRLAAKAKGTVGLQPSAPSGPVAEPTLPDGSRARLVRLRAEGGRLQVAGERALPDDFYPFFLLPEPRGEWLLSGVNSNVFRFAGLSPDLEGLGRAIDVLASSLQFGRILRLRADGLSEVVVKGAALYFNLDSLADGTVVYSVIRPGFRVIPPSLQAEWGVESVGPTEADQDYRELVGLAWTAILPPYALGVLSVQ